MKNHIGNFKVGDRVRRNRRYFKGTKIIGTIVSINLTTPQRYFPYSVRWDDGITLAYDIDELEKIKINNHPYTSIFK